MSLLAVDGSADVAKSSELSLTSGCGVSRVESIGGVDIHEENEFWRVWWRNGAKAG